MRSLVLSAIMASLLHLTAHAQCPDGSPPPCSGARRVPSSAPRPPAPPSASLRARRFLLLPFRNITRAPAQDWLVTGAPVMLGAALGQFQDLQVVPEERLTAALRRASLPTDMAPDADQLRRIAGETGGWTAVSGTVVASGGKLRIGVQALDVVTTKVLTRVEGEIAADADVRLAFDTLATRLLSVTGLSSTGAVNLAALTTHSVDAYRSYVAGLDAMRRADGIAATEAFAEAVRLDSTFTLAWARLGLVSVLWDARALTSPASIAFRAMERATRTGARLPPHEAAEVKAIQATFQGRMREAKAILDSAVASDPGDLEAREYLALAEMRDFVLVDTLAREPQLRGSMNRAARLLEDVLQRDPGRRSAFNWITGLYVQVSGGTSGQGVLPAFTRDVSSLAALMFPATPMRVVPVLRDSIEVMSVAAWVSLSRAERQRLQLRAAEVGKGWADRWLAVGPADATAHWYAAGFAWVLGDYDRVLRELTLASAKKSLVEAQDVATLRARTLLALGRVRDAARLSDSMRTAPGTQPRLLESLARVGVVARLLRGQWASALQLSDSSASQVRSPARGCAYMMPLLYQELQLALPVGVRVAVMDSVTMHFTDAFRTPGTGNCVVALATALAPEAEGQRRDGAVQPMLALLDSLEGTDGNDAELYLAGAVLRALDVAAAARLTSHQRLVRVTSDMSVLRRFEPGTFIVSGDSVTVTWHWIGPAPARWDVPGMFTSWALRARADVVQGRDTLHAVFSVEHSFQDGGTEARGGVAELLSAANLKGAYMIGMLPGMKIPPTGMAQFPGEARVDGDVVRLVVHGDIAEGLRRARPVVARFGLVSCAPVKGGLCDSPTVPIDYR